MARKKKEVVEQVIEEVKPKRVCKKKEEVVEEVKPKKTRKKKVEIDEPKVQKKSEPKLLVIENEPPKKRTRKKTKDDTPKLASVPPPPPPKEEPKKVEPPKPKKPKKPILKVKDVYEFEEGKYVLGDVEELFDEKLLKKMKTSIKKLSKKNHGKDDKLGIHYFKVGDKVWDFIEYNSKILTASNSLILCKSETVTKEGKLRFCKRFEAKEKFKVFVDYTKDDYCLYFYYEDTPSPFMMLNDEALI